MPHTDREMRRQETESITLKEKTWFGLRQKIQAVVAREVSMAVKQAGSAAEADQAEAYVKVQIETKLAAMPVVLNRPMCIGWNEEQSAAEILAEAEEGLAKGYLVRYYLDVKDEKSLQMFKENNRDLFKLLGLNDPAQFKAWIMRYYDNVDDRAYAESDPNHPLNWTDVEIAERLKNGPYLGVGSPVIILSEYEKEPAFKKANEAFEFQRDAHVKYIKKGIEDIKRWIKRKYGTEEQKKIASEDLNHPFHWEDQRIIDHLIDNAKNILSWHERLDAKRDRFNLMLYCHKGIDFYKYLTKVADKMGYSRDYFVRLTPCYQVEPPAIQLGLPVVNDPSVVSGGDAIPDENSRSGVENVLVPPNDFAPPLAYHEAVKKSYSLVAHQENRRRDNASPTLSLSYSASVDYPLLPKFAMQEYLDQLAKLLGEQAFTQIGEQTFAQLIREFVEFAMCRPVSVYDQSGSTLFKPKPVRASGDLKGLRQDTYLATDSPSPPVRVGGR